MEVFLVFEEAVCGLEKGLTASDRWALEILPLFLDIFKYLENNIKIND